MPHYNPDFDMGKKSGTIFPEIMLSDAARYRPWQLSTPATPEGVAGPKALGLLSVPAHSVRLIFAMQGASPASIRSSTISRKVSAVTILMMEPSTVFQVSPSGNTIMVCVVMVVTFCPLWGGLGYASICHQSDGMQERNRIFLASDNSGNYQQKENPQS